MIKLVNRLEKLFVANNNKDITVAQKEENLKELQLAMNHEYFDMKIQIVKEQIEKLESKILNKPDKSGKKKYSEEEVEGFKAQLEVARENLANFTKSLKECTKTYNKVLETISDRDKSAFKRFLRLQGAMYDSKCWGYVLELECFEDVETIYNCMEAIHNPSDTKVIGENGFVKANSVKDTINQANDALAKELRQLFSIFDKNPYIEKMALKFNKTALHKIHETYITGLRHGCTVDNDNNLTIKETTLSSSITKSTNKEIGETVYNCGRFGKNLAMIVKDIIIDKATK